MEQLDAMVKSVQNGGYIPVGQMMADFAAQQGQGGVTGGELKRRAVAKEPEKWFTRRGRRYVVVKDD